MSSPDTRSVTVTNDTMPAVIDTIEDRVLQLLTERETMEPRGLLADLMKEGFSGEDARISIWRLVERGEVQLGWDRMVYPDPDFGASDE